MSRLFQPAYSVEEQQLKGKINAALAETQKVREAALRVSTKAEADTAALGRVSEATQERVALLDAQRRLRTRNPTVTTATQALNLLRK